jgi:hypothetical protein
MKEITLFKFYAVKGIINCVELADEHPNGVEGHVII